MAVNLINKQCTATGWMRGEETIDICSEYECLKESFFLIWKVREQLFNFNYTHEYHINTPK